MQLVSIEGGAEHGVQASLRQQEQTGNGTEVSISIRQTCVRSRALRPRGNPADAFTLDYLVLLLAEYQQGERG